MLRSDRLARVRGRPLLEKSFRIPFIPLLCLVGLSGFHHGIFAETSKLWGEKGELWERDGLLRDFTEVGYRQGGIPIPDWPVGVSVTDFGAMGDGLHDDTQAFRDAIAACPERHAILVPKGTYRITEQIVLKSDDKSYFVLRGEDRFESVLWFPHYLAEIAELPPGKKSRGQNPLNLGFFWFDGGTHRSFENLSFVFRDQPAGNHWEFIGANAIYFSGVTDSWIRNVYFKNTYEAIRLWGTDTRNISVINAIFDQYIDRGSRVGHIPIAVSSSDSLFHNILLTGKWHHDILTHQAPQGNVWSRFRGPAIEIDHHSAGSDFGLFTEIDTGVGSTNQYDFYGDNETYWNIRSDLEVSFSNSENKNVIVGVNTSDKSTAGENFWHENITPDRLIPSNLYLAQLDLVGKPRPIDKPLFVPDQSGEVLVVPLTEAGPLRMGAAADKNFEGGFLVAKITYQDKNTEKFLLKFDLSEHTRGEVPRATLRLYAEKLGSLRVLSVEDDSWNSSTVTFNSAPVGNIQQSVNPSPVSPNWVDVDLTEFVRNQMGGDRVVSVLVESSKKGMGGKFASKGSMFQPRLIIEPEHTASYPVAPTGLRVTPVQGGVLVDWDDSTESDFKSYTLYRTPVVDKELEVFAGGLVDSEFEDKLVNPGTRYTYFVTATDTGTRESEPGPEVIFNSNNTQ